MKAILYYHYSSKLTGSVIDAFEYFIAILEYNPEFLFILVDGIQSTVDTWCSVFENRYTLSDINYRENIRCVSRISLIRMRFEKVLVLDYGTIPKVRGLVQAKKIVVISEKHTNDPRFMFRKDLYDVVYYGEMNFEYRDFSYRMKMLFNRYTPLVTVNEGIYINSPFNDDKSIVTQLALPNKPLLFKSRVHLTNLFEQFDEYVYYHANKWFDPHPRLMLECAFYNKVIHYYNPYDVIDGSYYRYYDFLEVGLEDRELNEDDIIIKEFI